MAGIFKAYDIRGVYGQDLTTDIACDIGRAFATLVGCRNVVVGRDMRPHSEPLFEALTRGLTTQGCDVIDLGLCSTPMSYYANGVLKAGGGIMITASHNTGEYNGFKLSRAQSIPISGDTGIKDIERMVAARACAAPAPRPGVVSRYDIAPEYARHVRAYAHLKRPLRVAADFANAMGSYEAKALEGVLRLDCLFADLDGSFPNHEANPLHHATLADLQTLMRAGDYDFGIAFDGDADRVGFLDERGDVVPMDAVTALVAQELLTREKGVIFYDLRSSRAVREVILENGGTPMMSRVGHTFIKQQMRDTNAIFAGELSGHYYFRENFFAESASMAVLCVANVVSRTGQPFSRLIAPLKRYVSSGEINSTVTDPAAAIARIRARFKDRRLLELDGLSVEDPDGWFNVRVSNTEPLIRLNVEARTRPDMEARRDEVLAMIRGAPPAEGGGANA